MAPSITRQSRAVWIGGSALASLVLAAATYLVGVSPQLDAADAAIKQTTLAQQDNDLTAIQNGSLQRLSQKLPTLQQDLRGALAALPPDSGLSPLTQELTEHAASAAVSLVAISVGGSAPTVQSSGGVASAAAAPYSVSITVQANGPLTHLTRFVHLVEAGPRAASVTSTQITEAAGARIDSIDAGAALTLQFKVFSAPMTVADVALAQQLLHASH